jgi:hypothetical protein
VFKNTAKLVGVFFESKINNVLIDGKSIKKHKVRNVLEMYDGFVEECEKSNFRLMVGSFDFIKLVCMILWTREGC